MDTILVVNAGSSSVKFQVFATEGTKLDRLIRGQMDGIGTRPRLRAKPAVRGAVSLRLIASDPALPKSPTSAKKGPLRMSSALTASGMRKRCAVNRWGLEPASGSPFRSYGSERNPSQRA
jgi:hypothetical protein